MWNVQRDIDERHAPSRLVVLRVEFFGSGEGVERYRLEIADGIGELGLTHPGLEEDLVMRTDARTLTEVWIGHRDFRQATACSEIQIEGPRELANELPSWFRLNHFVALERELAGG